jgi:hypothetical protein
VVRIFPECVTSPGWFSPAVRLLPLASGPACFGTAFPSFLMKMYTAVTRSSLLLLWERGIPEGENDCWVGEAVVLSLTTPYTPR